MTIDELRALPVAVNLDIAARALGISKSQAYALARTDKFPCPIIRSGHRITVPSSGLLALLGVAA